MRTPPLLCSVALSFIACLPAAAAPDLVVRSLEVFDYSDTFIKYRFMVENVGDSAANLDEVLVGGFASTDPVFDNGNDIAVCEDAIGGSQQGDLAPGETISEFWSIDFKSPSNFDPQVHRYLVLKVDCGEALAESDESNNTLAVLLDNTRELAEAIDQPGRSVINGGGAAWPWFGQTETTRDGVDAAQSGVIGSGESSQFQIEVSGPARVRFWWKVSSGWGSGYMRFYIDGAEQPGKITGNVDWRRMEFILPVGEHTLKWAYAKAYWGDAARQDCGWVDEVVVSEVGPEIAVEQPEDEDLADGAATVDFGNVVSGQSVSKTFTVRNVGTAELTGIEVNVDGPDASDFSVTEPGATSLAPGETTTFEVAFAPPGMHGIRQATLHIASSDADENPFDVRLAGSSPPPNDDFADAETLTGRDIEVAVDAGGSTREDGEPNPYDNWEANSLWYRWTAPADGPVFFLCLKPHWALSITVYTGDAVDSLTQVGTEPYRQKDNPGDPEQTAAKWWQFDAVAGTTYHIAFWSHPWSPSLNPDLTGGIAVYQNSSGFPPPNDDFAAATSLPVSVPSTCEGYNYGANHEVGQGEPDVPYDYFWYDIPFPTVWYRWTPGYSGFAELSLSGATCPLELTVYTGDALDVLSKVTFNDSSGPDGKITVCWECAEGATYRIRVAPASDAYRLDFLGHFRLNLRRLDLGDDLRGLVARARIQLESQSPGCVAQADSLLQRALALAPDDPEANFLRALTRLALLGESPAFKTLVGMLVGDPAPSLDPYQSGKRFDIPEDAQGRPVPPATSDPTLAVGWLNDELLPELAAVRAHFDKVPAGFTTSLSGAENGIRHLEVDRADVLALIGATHALEMFVHFLTTYDLSVPIRNLVIWDRTGELSATKVRATCVNLLTFSATDRRTEFRQEFTRVRQTMEAAADFARNQRTQPELHFWNSADIAPVDEQDAIAKGRLIEDSFNGANVALDSDVPAEEQINLAHFVESTESLRNWLPGIVRGKAVKGTLPDPTISGAFPSMTEAHAESLLSKAGLLIDLSTFSGFIAEFLDTLPPAGQGAGADPDGDGRSNEQEYAFGTNPIRPDVPRQTVAVVETTGQDVTRLRVTFTRRRDVIDLAYVVAVSDDMEHWDRSGATVTMVGAPVPNDDGLTESVEFSIQGLGGARPPRFVRLEATLAP